MRLGVHTFIAIFALVGCQTLPVDRSPDASASGDYTLAVSACEATPGRGMDICHVKEGSPIAAVWRIFPPGGETILKGEVTAYFRDRSKSYSIREGVVEIPLAELVGEPVWKREHDGEAMALASIIYKNADGIEELVKVRGIAKFVVTRVGYDPLPMDSSYGAFISDCRITYTTAGRSNVTCK